MDGHMNLFRCLLIYLFYLRSTCIADECIRKGPCTCEFSNGTGIDLTPVALFQSFFYTQTYKSNGTQYELHTYYYSPCSDQLLNTNTTAATDTCTIPLSICRDKNIIALNGTDTTGTYSRVSNKEFLGLTSVSNFSADGRSIIYANRPSKTQVLLVCAQVDTNLEVYSEAEPDSIILAFNSREACLKQLSEPTAAGRSLGSTLLVIFFSFVVLYLVLGICTKKFLMGATGLEVIPNLGFWSDLPNLVKDGWAFMINGFKLPARGAGPVASPDPNSYDSI